MLNGISIKSQISLAIAALIMSFFFMMEVLVVLEVIAASYSVAVFGLLCLLAFMPPFVVILSEFLINIKIKEERINSQLEGISRSNLVVTLTMDGYILKANPNFCSIMGCEEGHVIMQPHERMVTPEYADSEEYANFWATLRQGHSITGKFERVAKDGSKRWLYGNYTPIKNKDGVFDRVLKIATDVTTAHLAEEIVSQKTAYLEHAAKILRHDMHSGINTYLPRGISSLKRRLDEETIKEKRLQMPMRLIEDGLVHTQKVYKGVYEFTNLVREDSTLSKEECNIRDILDEYLQSTSYADQVVLCPRLPTLLVNEALFCTAVDNMIRNGLKYNDSKTKYVKVMMVDDDTLGIIDNGRGMSQEEYKKLSKPYLRREGQKEEGTGLGLNITVAICKEHGFELSAEKREEGGTIMRIKVK